MFHFAHARLFLCKPDLALGLRMDRGWVAHERLILSSDCVRTADFAHGASTGDEFWVRIADCAHRLHTEG
jgi:hypothetical protein